jgi:hypothetical protein
MLGAGQRAAHSPLAGNARPNPAKIAGISIADSPLNSGEDA